MDPNPSNTKVHTNHYGNHNNTAIINCYININTYNITLEAPQGQLSKANT